VTLRLSPMPGRYAVFRLAADAALPDWFTLTGELAAACRTADELSLLTPEEMAPAELPGERGLRAFKLAGPLDFAATGILAAIATPLAEAKIPIFAQSTFDTDYVLVPATHFARAKQILAERFDLVD
jgi:hypothetical protein